jgi:hypothetical protein
MFAIISTATMPLFKHAKVESLNANPVTQKAASQEARSTNIASAASTSVHLIITGGAGSTREPQAHLSCSSTTRVCGGEMCLNPLNAASTDLWGNRVARLDGNGGPGAKPAQADVLPYPVARALQVLAAMPRTPDPPPQLRMVPASAHVKVSSRARSLTRNVNRQCAHAQAAGNEIRHQHEPLARRRAAT